MQPTAIALVQTDRMQYNLQIDMERAAKALSRPANPAQP